MHAGLDIRIDESCKPFENHIRYCYSILLIEILEIRAGIPIQFVYSGCLSTQGNSDKATIHIIPSNFFREGKYLSSDSLPGCPISWIDAEVALGNQKSSLCDSKLPVLFRNEGKQQLYVKRQNNILTTNADFIASAYFMLTRYEEIIVEKTDEYGRFPFKESLAYKEGFFHRPIVNEYAELLWDWIVALVPQARRKKKAYQMRLTHDVDRVRKYGSIPRELRIGASLAIKYQQPWTAINHLTGLMKTRLGYCKDPYDSYDELMDISEELGSTGCFYFMAEETGSSDKRYELASTDVVSVIENILKRGHNIGLHPGIGSYLSLEKLHRQKEKLDKLLGYRNYGGRQHYLQWKAPDTWRLYEQVGLTHDSSVGYAEMPGFRCGICMPFFVFDALAGKQLNLTEIPLITTDTSLFSKKYNYATDYETRDNLLRTIKENIKKVTGNYCLLCHNTFSDKYGNDSLRYLTGD
jgi:hypothetical protein